MANCVRCGRELPSSSFGQSGDTCADCRRAELSNPSFSTPMPAPSARPAVARAWPPVTTALVGINLALFLVMLVSGVSPTEPTTQQLLKWGANWGPLSLGTQPWRMLTSNYVHIGVIHIFFNMWCLWNLGNLAERVFDRWTYMLVYTATGLAGSVVSLWWHPLIVGAGASGAIFGLAGALIAALYLGKLPIPKEAMRSTLKSLLIFAGYNLLYGLRPGTDNSAHLGGLLSGLALGAILAKHLMEPREVRQRWRLGVFVATAVALFAGFTFARQAEGYVVLLDRGANALQKGQIDEAVHDLEEAAAKKPDDSLVLGELGAAYIKKQDYAKAENVSQRGVQLNSNDFGAQYNLGLAQLKMGKTDQAVDALQKAVQLDPQDSNAQQALGQAYQAKGSTDEAQSAFRKAEALRKAGK